MPGYTNNALPPAERDGALLEVLRHAAEGRIVVDHEVVRLADVTDAWHRQATGTADRRIVVGLS